MSEKIAIFNCLIHGLDGCTCAERWIEDHREPPYWVVWSGTDKYTSLSTVGDGGSSLKLAADSHGWTRADKGTKRHE